MKKYILTLLFLFLVLVVTCVYQNTYNLYEKAHAKDKNTQQHVQIEQNTNLKKEQASEKVKVTQSYTALATQANKQSAKVKNLKMEAVLNEETLAKKEPTEANKTAQSPSFLEKVKATVLSVVSSETKNMPLAQNNLKEDKRLATKENTDGTVNTQAEEKEVVDYLLSVLKEQNVALSNRDKAESKLHMLIEKVLKDRQLAIENMEEASSDIEISHQNRLDKRDVQSQNNYELNTKKEGK